MRWDRLFDDLEHLIDAEERERERALELEAEALRVARLTLRERLVSLAAAGPLRVELADGRELLVELDGFGRDWFGGRLADAGRARSVILPIPAIASVSPSAEQATRSLAPAPTARVRLADRMGLSFVLRDLSRRRLPVECRTTTGGVHGTIDVVAADHLELAVHDAGTVRRPGELRGYRLIPFERLLLVRFD
ncbi:hypothetical protein [Agromyces seonyuensis]|uniref:Uncharacterized protein n=1 Tax=Agromyces seonyuensis TaxID=2662446 RepID=A0A6I4P070_9MICO|nr:hypothetical protein [Agromyces seonyuensis]MWB99936.1 hypothetical protein [Agromyces seonyuensis]